MCPSKIGERNLCPRCHWRRHEHHNILHVHKFHVMSHHITRLQQTLKRHVHGGISKYITMGWTGDYSRALTIGDVIDLSHWMHTSRPQCHVDCLQTINVNNWLFITINLAMLTMYKQLTWPCELPKRNGFGHVNHFHELDVTSCLLVSI